MSVGPPAAVSVTFDNLGEAAALERGEQPGDEPLGRALLGHAGAAARSSALLDEAGLRATFFVEGLNAELYPDTLRGLAAAGHEVACHGWRHEPWGGLEPAAERELLERSVERLDGLGLRPLGFRPPGGALTPATPALLRELGFRYCSPAGDTVSQAGGLVVLPFRWPLLDAFHYLPHFGGLRRELRVGRGAAAGAAARGGRGRAGRRRPRRRPPDAPVPPVPRPAGRAPGRDPRRAGRRAGARRRRHGVVRAVPRRGGRDAALAR